MNIFCYSLKKYTSTLVENNKDGELSYNTLKEERRKEIKKKKRNKKEEKK